MKKAARRLSFLIVGLAAVSHGKDAAAADAMPASADLLRFVDRGTQWLVSAAAEAPRTTPPTSTRDDVPAASAQPLVALAPPRGSVLVRDWRGSMRVAGEETLTDELRPSASYRMAVLRLASSGRLATYGQLGAGQWRLDPVLFPGRPCDDKLAGQVGGGLQLRATERVGIGAEALYTVVYREPEDAAAPRFFTLMLAARASF